MSMNNAERWLVKEKSLINHLFSFSKLTEMFLRRPRLLIIVDKLL